MTPYNSSQGGEGEGSGATRKSGQPAFVASPSSPAVSTRGFNQAQSVADVLERAADLIAAPGAWTQFPFGSPNGSARDADGRAFYAPQENATCWCIYGAIAQICGADFNQSSKASRAIEDGGDSVSWWNDSPERTQDEVVSKLRDAAAKARSEQGA